MKLLENLLPFEICLGIETMSRIQCPWPLAPWKLALAILVIPYLCYLSWRRMFCNNAFFICIPEP